MGAESLVIDDIGDLTINSLLSYIGRPLMFLVGVIIAYLLIFYVVRAFMTVVKE